jgi:hypothetical protein
MLEHDGFTHTPGASQHHGPLHGCLQRQLGKRLEVGAPRPSGFLGINALPGTPPWVVQVEAALKFVQGNVEFEYHFA